MVCGSVATACVPISETEEEVERGTSFSFFRYCTKNATAQGRAWGTHRHKYTCSGAPSITVSTSWYRQPRPSVVQRVGNRNSQTKKNDLILCWLVAITTSPLVGGERWLHSAGCCSQQVSLDAVSLLLPGRGPCAVVGSVGSLTTPAPSRCRGCGCQHHVMRG